MEPMTYIITVEQDQSTNDPVFFAKSRGFLGLLISSSKSVAALV